MSSNIFDRFSFLSLFLTVILLPLFCLPFTTIPVETSKGLLLVLGLALSVIFWAIARFMDGRIAVPRSKLLLAGLGIVVVFLLSALISTTREVSLFGTMFDAGSFWFIFSAFLLMLMCSMTFRTPQQAKTVLLWTILSSALVVVFQIAHLFAPHALSLGILTDKTSNILGSWNALGVFAGFSTLMFLLVIEFFPISKIEKIVLEIFILLSVFLTAAVNFPLVWIMLGVSSLIIFVYKVSSSLQNGSEAETKRKNFPAISFIVVIVSLFFFLNPLISASIGYLDNFIPSHLKIVTAEISPSFSATMTVTKGVVKSHPVLGIGPNRFAQAWALYKPQVINTSQFWNASFDSGSGLLLTLVATTGILGIIAWLVFLGLFLSGGVKSVFSGIKRGVNWEIMAFFVLSLYLFISAFLYSTGVVAFLVALAFTGVFAGLMSKDELAVSFLNDHRKSFFSILALILLIVVTLALAFKYIERFTSISFFEKTLAATTEPVAEDNIAKALSLYTNDLYFRTYSQVMSVKMNTLVNKGNNITEADKADLETSFQQSLNGAQLAVQANPGNYLNYQLLGSLYQTAGALGQKGSYANAVSVYQTASALNPANPGLKLAMAGASFSDGKIKEAKDYANQALALKPDYLDALITLAQISKSEGNTSAALSYAQAALKLDPTNKDLIQYVNSLSSTPAPVTPATDSNKSKQ